MNYLCPTCDREVAVGKHCSHCSKKKSTSVRERKSWEDDGHTDGLDLPDNDFDYDEFIAREFGNAPHRKVGIAWYWYVVALLLLVAFIFGALR